LLVRLHRNSANVGARHQNDDTKALQFHSLSLAAWVLSAR